MEGTSKNMFTIRHPNPFNEVKRSHDVDKQTEQSQEFHPIHKRNGNYNFEIKGTSTFNFKESFLYQVKPSLCFLRVIGAFPVRFGPSGLPLFKYLSPITTYSLCLYILLNYITWTALKDYWLDIIKSDGDLSDSIYTVLFMKIFLFNVWIPLLAWVDVKRTCEYFTNWIEFQKEFVTVTKDPVELNIRKYSISSVLATCALAFIPISLIKFVPHMTICRLPALVGAAAFLACTLMLKTFTFTALKKAGMALRRSFKRSLKRKPISPNVMEHYRLLWLRWSKLVSEEDHMLGTIYAFMFIKMLIVLAITLYCSLMDLKTGKMDPFRQLNSLVGCWISAVVMYAFCRNAHVLTDLGNKFQMDLQLISPSAVSSHVWSEVKAFLHVIEMNPAVVTAMGFTKVDKTLFMALMSTMVTYMVVLLQFDKGDPSSNTSNGNSSLLQNTKPTP